MHDRGRTIRIRWWVWVTLLAVAFAVVAAGLGWFLVIMVTMSWLAVALFNRAIPVAEEEHDRQPVPQSRDLLAQPPSRLGAALRGTPSVALCQLWEQTGHDLRRTYLPSTLCAYAELRQAILDELTRRDPDGVQRWLHDQPDRRELSGYLHDQHR